MVSFEDFKSALGEDAMGLSDKEIREMNDIAAQIAGAFFDDWYKSFESGVPKVDTTNVVKGDKIRV